jgi:hypothetical protein
MLNPNNMPNMMYIETENRLPACLQAITGKEEIQDHIRMLSEAV